MVKAENRTLSISVTVRFASAQPGYPDWLWTVSVADVEGGEPTVLEAELLPGEGSLLAPDWLRLKMSTLAFIDNCVN